MINHARTLLINMRAADVSNDATPYVSPLYRPVVLPSAWQAIHQILFGTSPDFDMVLYRTAQFLPFLHTATFVGYTTAFDPRITYRIPLVNVETFPRSDVNAVVTQDNSSVIILGEQVPPDDSGRMKWFFEISIPSPNTVKVRDLKTQEEQIINALLTDGLSDAYPLGKSGHSFKLNDLTVSQKWLVSTKRPPERNPGQLLATINQHQATAIAALGDLAEREPYKSFVNYWTKQSDMPEMFAAVLLLLIYVTENQRAKT